MPLIFVVCLLVAFPQAARADVDADAYSAAITSAGGTISASDLTAITTFVTAAKANGYWTKLIDVGPMAGNQLAAALVKLKYPTGSSTLTNFNFVSSDYSPTTGLQGSSSVPKYLDTGVVPRVSFTAGKLGFAFWVAPNCIESPTIVMGTSNDTSPYIVLGSAGAFYGGGTGNSFINPYAQSIEGFIHGIRQSTSLLRSIVNGKIIATDTNVIATASTSKNVNIGVFAGISSFYPYYSSPTNCRGLYYSIDDGTMSNSEAIQYYQDVKQLLISLGRVRTTGSPMKMTLIVGQSLATGSNGSPALTTTPLYTNRTFAEGSRSIVWDSVMTTLTGLKEYVNESIATSFTNFVSSTTRSSTPGDTSQDLVLGNFGAGGWPYSLLKAGAVGITGPFAVSTSSVSNLVTLSSQYTTGGVVVPGILSVHGESDMNSDTYQTDIRQWQSDYDAEIKALTGQSQNVVMFHSQPSAWTSTGNTNSATGKSPYMILAESELNPTKTVLVGPKYFLKYGTGSDGVHLTNIGYRTLGEYYAKAWNKVIVLGGVWNPLRPSSVVLNGTNIDITFTGNVGNLVLDTTAISNPGNYGFEYFDNSSSASISSVSITGSDTVRVSLNQTPVGANKRIRYAFTGVAGNDGGTTTGPRGNLRDSDTELSMYDDNSDGLLNDRLYDWAVHFDKRIPITLTGTSATPTSSSASVALTLGMVASSSRVYFGPSSSYGTSTNIITNSAGPSFTLSSLKPCSIYHYMASSTGPSATNAPVYDPSGVLPDTSTSTDQSFTTAGCTGSASVTASSTASITTAAGGSTSLGTLSLIVPTSYTATTSSAHFQIKQLGKSAFTASAGSPTGKSLVGDDVFNMGALIDATTTLATFIQPLSITMSYDPSDISGISESSLKIHRYDGSVWHELTCSAVNTGAHTVTCQTSAFSDFALFGDAVVVPTPSSSSSSSSGSRGYVFPWGSTTACPLISYPVITRNIGLGSAGTEFLLLQKVLEAERLITTGPNSSFNSITQTAVADFQKKYGIVTSGSPSTTGYGHVGPKTRAYINDFIKQGRYPGIAGCVPSSSSVVSSTLTPGSVFGRTLTLGSSGSDVRALQVFLNSHGFIITSKGPGSVGNETQLFGSLTKAALIRFQEAYRDEVLVPNGLSKGTGLFGPATMKKVNSMK